MKYYEIKYHYKDEPETSFTSERVAYSKKDALSYLKEAVAPKYLKFFKLDSIKIIEV